MAREKPPSPLKLRRSNGYKVSFYFLALPSAEAAIFRGLV